MRNCTSPSAGSTIVDKLKVYEGGTGNTDAAAARAALGLVALTELNAPNGIAGLDANGQISAAAVPDDGAAPISLQGPTTAIINKTIAFVITNYDIFTAYTITASGGTVVRDKSNIYFTAGGAAGAGSLTINGRTVNITIQGVQPVAPTLAVNDNGGSTTNVVVNGTGSAFTMNTTSANTHLNSDWQLATDAAFTNIVTQSLADATNKIGWSGTGLNTSTTYYMRVRYRDNTNAVSDWSNTATITTRAVFYVQTEEARLVGPSPAASDNFGTFVAINETGNRVAVTMSGNTKKVFVFLRTGSVWNLETTFTDGTDNQFANKGLAISDAGDVLVICGYVNFTVCTRSGTTWTQGAKNGYQGSSYPWNNCAISGDGNKIAVTYVDNNSGQYSGTVYVYNRSGTSATYQYSISDPGNGTNWFGYGTALSTDGSYLAITCANGSASAYVCLNGVVQAVFTSSGMRSNNQSIAINGAGDRLVYMLQTSNSSKAVVWKRTGTTWAQEQVLSTGNTSFFAINKIGDQVVLDDNGAMKVFTRSGTTWTNVKTLTASTTASNNNTSFGSIIALSGDGTRSAIGANYATSASALYAGAVYIHAS